MNVVERSAAWNMSGSLEGAGEALWNTFEYITGELSGIPATSDFGRDIEVTIGRDGASVVWAVEVAEGESDAEGSSTVDVSLRCRVATAGDGAQAAAEAVRQVEAIKSAVIRAFDDAGADGQPSRLMIALMQASDRVLVAGADRGIE